MTEGINGPSQCVIGAAIEVYRVLRPGYLESVDEEALCVELAQRGVSYSRQHMISLKYKDAKSGQARLDVLTDDRLVVELKAVDEAHPTHTAQVISYVESPLIKSLCVPPCPPCPP